MINICIMSLCCISIIDLNRIVRVEKIYYFDVVIVNISVV